ncbi:coproporphyrinogen-III oxidase family protein [Lacisediminihabitans changchengi]|uniref:Heme chaperone HemW n=1 Tax=Lacisediminihabitans changchengi TaxID=2787634 RepID=A0A934VX71_9MICO|nr:coproporphyrinogen-III oxidase family protein [Lacisediminihabitans changchengi]MBK4346592.1 radical SAM protein [Lacisediminihabitans changchengi]
MPSALPLADPAPADGLLPASVADGVNDRNFGVYLHVPFCRVRCGYCDFNTYTSDELRGAKRTDYAGQAIAEVALAGSVLSGLPHRDVSTVFFGGGTPTMLPATDLAAMLAAVSNTWSLAPGAEVTTEANPDSVDAAYLLELAAAGFTRVSFGMQSAVPHVLATLERTHDPARVPLVVEWAREAGLDVSLDLIYGTPGESLDDWRASLEHAIAQRPDHISAYALIVEDGTKLARQIRRGEVAQPDDDLQADMYELADRLLADAGYEWYEVSNWAKRTEPVATDTVADPITGGESAEDLAEHRSRHNLAYWQGHDWWGIGPGAHSHVGGVRWWNVKHPAAYAERMLAGVSPAAGRETLDAETRRVERVLLGSRIREGIAVRELTASGRTAVAGLIAEELVDPRAAIRGTIELTLKGRLLADLVVRRLLAED